MSWFLSQQYPFDRQWRHQIRVAGWISLFVTLFLLLFQPFGIGNYEAEGLTFKIAGYGVLTFVVLLLVFSVTRWLRPEPDEETWTTGKEIISQLGYIFFIGLANVLYTHFVFGMHFSLRAFAIFQGYTILIGIFPVSFFVLMNQARLYKSNLQSAAAINDELQHRHRPAQAGKSSALQLTSENDKDVLDLDVENLVLIESADNYSTVYFMRDGQLHNKLLRTSLKRLEEQVRHDDLLRCHRTYIVNLQKVISVTGNAQGYRLRFEGFDQTFPVSRAMNEIVREKLRHLK